MESTSQAVQVDLRSLVELLSHHLYSTPTVVVRELLQNGVDALHARRLKDPSHAGALEVSLSGGETPVLVVEDDGVGLTRSEVHEFLSTIGRSSKRDELNFSRGDFLGQFGIGLLSGFMVADEVVVVTKSSSEPALTWRGRSDGTYTVDAAPDRPQGTSVYLALRADAAHLFKDGALEHWVEHYAALLPDPVEVRTPSGTTNIGGTTLPWDRLDREDLLAWGSEEFDEPFGDAVLVRDAASESTGVAFIAAHPLSPGVRQKHRVTLKGMLLSDRADGLLPDWAFFARVVLDTRGLHPTASRESLVDDDALTSLRDSLGECLRSWLEDLADRDPERLQAFVATHHASLKALSIHDPDLFTVVYKWLPVETSLGTQTLGALVLSGEPVRVAPTRDVYRQLLQVCAVQGLCLVNGGYAYDSELLECLAREYPELDLVVATPSEMLSVLDEVHGADLAGAERLAAIGTTVLARWGCRATVRSFRPASVPALFLADRNERFRRDVQATKADVAPLWDSVLQGVAELAAPESSTELCLNHNNALVRDLAALPDGARLRAGLELLYVQALLLGHHTLDPSEARLVTSSVHTLIQEP